MSAAEGIRHIPRVSVVIPSWDGYRNGCLPALIDAIEHQTFKDYEVFVVQQVAPQGRAINEGARKARGSVILILDDDSALADDSVFQRLIDTLDQDPQIGMAGASIVVSPNATLFQQRAAQQFPRFNMPIVECVTDSDLACHGCCVIRKDVFDAVGGEREDILRGLDPDLRVRIRAAGYRVVLAPDARVYHPLPDGWKALARTFLRNGYGSVYARKFHPDAVYETHEKLNSASFTPKTLFLYRAARFPVRLLKALATGQWMRFVAYSAYAFGYVWGWLFARKISHHDGN